MEIQEIVFPINNSDFLKVISNSFCDFLENGGTSRSTAKLKKLHGAIAKDIAIKLGHSYSIKSQGYGNDAEDTIHGRYIEKKVDITISREHTPIAGLAVKFVMQNYSQNSNNYFENMLGETANIRCNGCPYFQIFIIFDRLPYYDKQKSIRKWETLTEHNVHKYVILSQDNIDRYFHTPNKTLLYVVHIPDNDRLGNLDEYLEYYNSLDNSVTLSQNDYDNFGDSVILNDYEQFRNKVYHTIMSL